VLRPLLCGATNGALLGAAVGGALSWSGRFARQDELLAAAITALGVAVAWWSFAALRASARRLAAWRYARRVRRWRRAELEGAVRPDEDDFTVRMEQTRRRRRPDAARNQALLAEARGAVQRSDFSTALVALSDLIEVAPAHYEAWLTRGRIFRDLGEFDRAMADLTKAETLSPYSPEPPIAMGELCYARKDYARAVAYYDTALVMVPDDAATYERRGLAHFHRKNNVLALEDFRRAKKLDPASPTIAAHLAMTEKRIKAESAPPAKAPAKAAAGRGSRGDSVPPRRY
jgi:tetratricopeptide (TPR) repeat protein